jgi:hypothetical protein
MSKPTKAPTLFGKRMRWHPTAASWYGTSGIGHGVAVRSQAGSDGKIRYWFEWDHFAFGNDRRTPQSAANDAERYLRRLKKQLERMMGDV